MPTEPPDMRNSSSQILPLVLAAFAGATLAIACERPASRVSEDSYSAANAKTAQVPAQQSAQAQTPAAAIPPREALADPAITTRIKGAIQRDPAMTGADVSVSTDHGAVTLLGAVKSHDQIAIASAHAQREDGVMRVDNHLAVTHQ